MYSSSSKKSKISKLLLSTLKRIFPLTTLFLELKIQGYDLGIFSSKILYLLKLSSFASFVSNTLPVNLKTI